MNFDNQTYALPRKLSRDHNGPSKPRQRLASIHRQKFRQQTAHNTIQHNPQHPLYKVSDILTASRRLDKDVMQQRSQLITHSTRVSKQSPQWWKSTFNYFKHSQMDALSKSMRQQGTQQKKFDVFNRKRNSYMTIDNMRMDSIYNNKPAMASRESGRSSAMSSSNQQNRLKFSIGRSLYAMREVSPKVGSLDIRDYTIKKPLLKIGANNYVDTYSVF